MKVIAWACLVAGCGGTTAEAPPKADDVGFPSARDVEGEWRHDYVTAGASTLHGDRRFGADGIVTSHSTSMYSFTEPVVVTDRSGSYDVNERGVVRTDWESDGVVDEEETFVVVEGRALDEVHSCCHLIYDTGRWWTFRGYLAEDSTRRRYRRDSLGLFENPNMERIPVGIRVELALSASPAQLARGAACSLDVAVHLDTRIGAPPATADFAVTLPCVVHEEAPGFLVMLFVGRDTVQGQSLAEVPSAAHGIWRTLLGEHPELLDWPSALRLALDRAFELYLVVDLARPHVLFHYLDGNALTPAGYAWVK